MKSLRSGSWGAVATIPAILGLVGCFVTVSYVNAQTLIGENLIDIGNLSGSKHIHGRAINERGQVTGSAYFEGGFNHAFFYSDGTITDLGTLGGALSSGMALNDSGVIVGSSGVAYGTGSRPFIFSGGTMSELGSFATNSSAMGINNSGQVVINADIDGVRGAFLFSGAETTLLAPTSGIGSYAHAINNSAQVTGYSYLTLESTRGFINTNGAVTTLGTVGGDLSFGLAINSSGDVAGTSYTARDPLFGDSIHGFVFSEGSMHDLGVLPGGDRSLALGINDVGMVVGSSTTEHSGVEHGIVFSGSTMYDLNVLFSAFMSDGTKSGFTHLGAAEDINNNGQIVGVGIYYTGEQHQVRSYIATIRNSVPDSGATVLLLCLSISLLCLINAFKMRSHG